MLVEKHNKANNCILECTVLSATLKHHPIVKLCKEPSDEDADEEEESEAGGHDDDDSLRALSSHEHLEDASCLSFSIEGAACGVMCISV